MRRSLVAGALLLWSGAALAQSTGNSFPTPNGQITGGTAILLPTGPITNGQPVMGPPGPQNGLYTICTNCSPSAPIGASSNPTNGTITTTNTFQSLVAQNSNRKGCVFQNQGTHTMYFSLQSSPTLAGSLQVPPSYFFYCSGPSNIVVTDQIWITGTTADAFSGNWQ